MHPEDAWNEYQEHIAQGCLTNSKHPNTHVYGVYHKVFRWGIDEYIYSTDGKKRWLDFICGLGTNLLGYGNKQVSASVASALKVGNSPSMPTRTEVDVAKKLKETFIGFDKVKFLKTGSEACSAAIRYARAHTGRQKILSQGYHGWHDSFTSITPPAMGVVRNQKVEMLTGLMQIDDDVAAVIIEPIETSFTKARKDYLTEVRELCTKHGVLLIFDEIITGLRFNGHSVSNLWNIRPDMICLGKALGNGFPLAAVMGPRQVMDNPDVFVSSTYSGDVISLVAANAVLNILKTDPNYRIDQLWEDGIDFITKFNSFYPHVQITGYPTRGAFVGGPEIKALFFQEAFKAGMLFGPSWFYNFPLMKHKDNVLSACQDILTNIRLGKVKLEGKVPKSPFSVKYRKGD